MNEEKLAPLIRAHAIGVQDALLALQLVVSKSGKFSPEIQAEILTMGQNLVVLPTRVYRELIEGGLTR